MLSIASIITQPLLLFSAGVGLYPPPDPRARRLAWLIRRRPTAASREPAGAQPSGFRASSVGSAAKSGGRTIRFEPSPRQVVVPAAAAALVFAVVVHQVVAAAFLLVMATALHRLSRSLVAERQAEKNRADLVSAVGALVDEHAAGVDEAAALRAAAGSAGQYRDDFTDAATAITSGSSRAELRFGNRELGRLNAAYAVSAATGSRLSAVLSAVGDDLHRDAVVRHEVRSALAAPRSSALLLAGLPLVGVGLGSAMGASPLTILLHTGWGASALAVGTILDLAGLGWTMAMARRATP